MELKLKEDRGLETTGSKNDDVDTEPVPWSRIVTWEAAKTREEKRKPRLFNVEIRKRNPSF